MTISVLIPTYNRHDLLVVALESLLSQQESIKEVLIGDDSSSEHTTLAVKAFLDYHRPAFQIRYYRHEPPLGQGMNVEALVKACSTDLFLLLHDDDYLLPKAIEVLSKPFVVHPHIVASFGTQVLVTHTGVSVADPLSINRSYYRTPDRVGIVDGKIAAEIQMFPNDGYLVRTHIVQEIGYFDPSFGTSVDTAFGLRLGSGSRQFYFTNTEVAAYRLTNSSIRDNSTGSMHHVAYLLNQYPDMDTTPDLIQKHLKYKLPVAIAIALRTRNYANAFRWSIHPAHRAKLLSAGGIKRLFRSTIGLLISARR